MEQEYLSEQKYQKVKKGLVVLGVVVLFAFIICSYIFLLTPGLEKRKEATNYRIPTEQEILNQTNAIEEKYGILEAEVEEKYDTLEKEIENKYTKKMSDDGWFEENRIKSEELAKLNIEKVEELTDLEFKKSTELSKVNSSIDNGEFEKARIQSESLIYLGFGVFVIFFGLIVSAGIFSAAFGRNIFAFKTQQVMPVAKEGIEKMSPTFGTVAKDITKGVKEGLKDKE